jgi:hypothetical protein
MPDWVKKDSLLEHLSYQDRQGIAQAQHALVAEYDATSIGEPDPTWAGKEPKSIQDLKFQSAMLASMALWLVQPSSVCFTVALHAISWTIPGQPHKQPLLQQVDRHTPLFCHPDHLPNSVSAGHAVTAGKLHEMLLSVPRKNAVWTALRAFWAGLTSYARDLRYPLFWIGLEALFGPEDNTGEITYKLSQRIAFFLSDTPEGARDIFRKSKACYGARSQIVHGRWEDSPKMDVLMGDTENIVRSVMLRMMNDAEMLKTFLSKQRDKFLEDWVFSRDTSVPPTDKT